MERISKEQYISLARKQKGWKEFNQSISNKNQSKAKILYNPQRSKYIWYVKYFWKNVLKET